jgi:hypothetical protein
MIWQEGKRTEWGKEVASTLKIKVQAKTKAKIMQCIFTTE